MEAELIGVEVAEILLHAGIKVEFLIREEWYFPIALNKAEANFVSDHMRQHGCNVHLEVQVDEIIYSDGQVKGIELNNGTSIDLDFVAICIGVVPATGFLESSEIELNERSKGVEVNQYLEASVNDIYAAGDCASVEWFDGQRRPEQLWYTSRDQGLVAAKNMLGDKISYKRGTFYNSAKFFDIEYTTAGLVNWPLENLSEWYQKHPSKPISQRIVIQNDKVIGFNMLGSRWNHENLVQWINQGRSLEWVLDNLRTAQYDAEFSEHFKTSPGAMIYEL